MQLLLVERGLISSSCSAGDLCNGSGRCQTACCKHFLWVELVLFLCPCAFLEFCSIDETVRRPAWSSELCFVVGWWVYPHSTTHCFCCFTQAGCSCSLTFCFSYQKSHVIHYVSCCRQLIQWQRTRRTDRETICLAAQRHCPRCKDGHTHTAVQCHRPQSKQNWYAHCVSERVSSTGACPEKPDARWVESAEAEGVIQDPCLVDTIFLPCALIYRTTPQTALLKNARYKIHKSVPEQRIYQQLYRKTRKNDIISLVRRCRTPPAVNALATGVSVTVYAILSIKTATSGVIALFSLAPLGF